MIKVKYGGLLASANLKNHANGRNIVGPNMLRPFA